jgi:hypothetical protein
MGSDVSVSMQRPIFHVPTPLHHYCPMFYTLPVGNAALSHVADNVTTNSVTGTLFLRRKLLVVWWTAAK